MASPTALITGGTSGIGLATARLLHRRGYGVVVTGRDPASNEVASGELGDDVAVVRADARSLADTDRLAEAVRTRLGGLDLLFLNAGIVRSAPVEEIDEATYDDLFAVNTKGAFFTLQKVLPLLRDGASVVVTVGVGTTRGRPGASVSAATRGALLAMVPSLARELAPRRIRVNAVSPGAVETPIWAKNAPSPEAAAATLESVAASIPLGRLGTPDDVAEVVAFLASDGAAYVTGQDVVVGGGIEV